MEEILEEVKKCINKLDKSETGRITINVTKLEDKIHLKSIKLMIKNA